MNPATATTMATVAEAVTDNRSPDAEEEPELDADGNPIVREDEEEDDDNDRDDNVACHGCCVVEGLGCGGGGGGSWWGLESAVTARIGGLCGSCVFFSLSELFSRVELVS